MTDHYEPIISIDSSFDLDMYVTASNYSCILRVASTHKYFLTITPDLNPVSSNVKYRIYKVLISPRGYVIIQAKSLFKAYNKDMMLVYTINGAAFSFCVKCSVLSVLRVCD